MKRQGGSGLGEGQEHSLSSCWALLCKMSALSALFLNTQNNGEKASSTHNRCRDSAQFKDSLYKGQRLHFQLKSLDGEWTTFCRSRTLSSGQVTQCQAKEVGRLSSTPIPILSFSSGTSRGKMDLWRLFAHHTSLNQSTVLNFRIPGESQGRLCLRG